MKVADQRKLHCFLSSRGSRPLIRMSRIASCRFLYFSSMDGELQLLNTCLFVWIAPHRRQFGDWVLPHLWRFEAVASCCNNAFLTNRYRCSGRKLTIEDHFSFALSSNDSIAERIRPWILKLESRFEILDWWASFRALHASSFELLLFAIKSKFTFFDEVEFQMAVMSWSELFFKAIRVVSRSFSAVELGSW